MLIALRPCDNWPVKFRVKIFTGIILYSHLVEHSIGKKFTLTSSMLLQNHRALTEIIIKSHSISWIIAWTMNFEFPWCTFSLRVFQLKIHWLITVIDIFWFIIHYHKYFCNFICSSNEKKSWRYSRFLLISFLRDPFIKFYHVVFFFVLKSIMSESLRLKSSLDHERSVWCPTLRKWMLISFFRDSCF